MKIHTTLRNGGKKKNERKSTDLQTQNETYSEAPNESLKYALFLVPGPQRKNTSFSRIDQNREEK